MTIAPIVPIKTAAAPSISRTLESANSRSASDAEISHISTLTVVGFFGPVCASVLAILNAGLGHIPETANDSAAVEAIVAVYPCRSNQDTTGRPVSSFRAAVCITLIGLLARIVGRIDVVDAARPDELNLDDRLLGS